MREMVATFYGNELLFGLVLAAWLAWVVAGSRGLAQLAERYLATAWEVIAYIADRYRERVFLGVGLPYNSALIGLDEVQEFGRWLAAIGADVQLCVLDYFPTFRRGDLRRVTSGQGRSEGLPRPPNWRTDRCADIMSKGRSWRGSDKGSGR